MTTIFVKDQNDLTKLLSNNSSGRFDGPQTENNLGKK
jgi:hypothetical protein